MAKVVGTKKLGRASGEGNSGGNRRAASTKLAGDDEEPKERIRRSIMERAAKSATLCIKRVNALNALVNRFHGDATPSQARALTDLAAALGDAVGAVEEVGGYIAVLKDSNYRPRMSAGNSTRSLQAGQVVQVKAKKYDPEFHGANDDLMVIKVSGPNVLVKHGDKGVPFPIPRSFLELAQQDIGYEPEASTSEDDAG